MSHWQQKKRNSRCLLFYDDIKPSDTRTKKIENSTINNVEYLYKVADYECRISELENMISEMSNEISEKNNQLNNIQSEQHNERMDTELKEMNLKITIDRLNRQNKSLNEELNNMILVIDELKKEHEEMKNNIKEKYEGDIRELDKLRNKNIDDTKKEVIKKRLKNLNIKLNKAKKDNITNRLHAGEPTYIKGGEI